MAYTITSPRHSFIQFGETGEFEHCIFGTSLFCLPVYDDNDIAFQFFVIGTESEIDALCGVYGLEIEVGIVNDCQDEGFLLSFTGGIYNDQPEIYRLSDTQLLVNWAHGVPGFTSVISVDECFRIKVQVGATTACSNCLKRTGDNCFTSVIDYTNDENFAGFNYCSSGPVDTGGGDTGSCDPTIIQFTNQSVVVIPYTQSLKDRYGDVPSVQVWISDGTNLVNMGISAVFDDYPVNTITVDMGGPGSGIIVIR